MDHEQMKAAAHAAIASTTSYSSLLGMLHILVDTSRSGAHTPEFFISELQVLSAQFQRLINTNTLEK